MPNLAYHRRMNTLETDVEIGVDGSVKLLSPMPAWLKPGRAHVLLTVETSSDAAKAKRSKLTATPEMMERRKAALGELRAMGGLSRAIPDPVAWQKEMREDRPRPGRD